jgi:predicted enzyme related to lactoylglutathione lyase
MLAGLNFVLVHVDDVTAARAFYTEKLGLTVADEAPGFVQFAQPGGQGAAYALIERGAEVPELWWDVENADEAYAELKRQGVELASGLEDRPFGRVFSIKDPAGNTLHLMQQPKAE